MNHRIFFASIFLFCACKTPSVPESRDVWKKIKLNFNELDLDGLRGSSASKVAVNYEFCIPNDPEKWKTVSHIDPSAARQIGSRGRAGCGEQQWLVIGSTHQKNYQRVLYELASLDFVEKIEQTFWE
jgi:hypothetical protein